MTACLDLEKEPTFLGFRKSRSCYMLKFAVAMQSKAFPSEFVVKIYTKIQSTDVACNPSENAYKHLEKLSHVLPAIPMLEIQQPFIILPKINGIATAWMPGTTLQDLMNSGHRFATESDKRQLAEHFKNVGMLLGSLKACTHDANVHIAEYYLKLKLHLLANEIHRSILKNSKIVKRALKSLKEFLQTFSWTKLDCYFTHGDFVHSNIIITKNNKIAIVDFAESRMDSHYHDLTRFTVRTMLDYGYNSLKYSQNDLNKLNECFLMGYLQTFPEKFSSSDELFHFYRTFNALQFTSLIYNANLKTFLSFHTPYELLLLDQYTKQLTRMIY